MPNLTCIKTYHTRIDADMAKSYLEANGIKSEVFVDRCFGIGQALQDSAPGARLMVNEQDAQKAEELLKNSNGNDS